MRTRWSKWVVMGLVAVWLNPVAGACTGSSSTGGHDQGGAVGSTEPHGKADKAIGAILADESRRESLMAAILDDPRFMRELVARIAEFPEWRALLAEMAGRDASAPLPPPVDASGEGEQHDHKE